MTERRLRWKIIRFHIRHPFYKVIVDRRNPITARGCECVYVSAQLRRTRKEIGAIKCRFHDGVVRSYTDKELRQMAADRAKAVGNIEPPVINETKLWEYKLFTNNGTSALSTDPGNDLFYGETPPVDRSEIKNSAKPRVLVCATRSGHASITDDEIALIAINNGIVASFEIVRSAEIAYFWENFFGSENFLDEEVTVPDLIVTTGYMRNHSEYGGETVPVTERLEQLCTEWGIPFVQFELARS